MVQNSVTVLEGSGPHTLSEDALNGGRGGQGAHFLLSLFPFSLKSVKKIENSMESRVPTKITEVKEHKQNKIIKFYSRPLKSVFRHQ